MILLFKPNSDEENQSFARTFELIKEEIFLTTKKKLIKIQFEKS